MKNGLHQRQMRFVSVEEQAEIEMLLSEAPQGEGELK